MLCLLDFYSLAVTIMMRMKMICDVVGFSLIGGYYAAFNQAVISPRCVCTCVLSSLYSAFLLFWRRSGLIDPMFYDPKGSFLIGSHFCDL